jgi:hypothetical protein
VAWDAQSSASHHPTTYQANFRRDTLDEGRVRLTSGRSAIDDDPAGRALTRSQPVPAICPTASSATPSCWEATRPPLPRSRGLAEVRTFPAPRRAGKAPSRATGSSGRPACCGCRRLSNHAVLVARRTPRRSGRAPITGAQPTLRSTRLRSASDLSVIGRCGRPKGGRRARADYVD